MDFSLFITALQLAIYVGAALVAAALCGGFVVGIFRVVTQIDDPSIQLAGRLSGVVLFVYFAAAHFSAEVLSFTQRVWGGADFYR